MTVVSPDTDSSLRPKTSPAVTLVFQPVSVESVFLLALESVGFADAAMVSAKLGELAGNEDLSRYIL